AWVWTCLSGGHVQVVLLLALPAGRRAWMYRRSVSRSMDRVAKAWRKVGIVAAFARPAILCGRLRETARCRPPEPHPWGIRPHAGVLGGSLARPLVRDGGLPSRGRRRGQPAWT